MYIERYFESNFPEIQPKAESDLVYRCYQLRCWCVDCAKGRGGHCVILRRR